MQGDQTVGVTPWVRAYLDVLGLPLKSPSLSYLNEICRAHLTTFPFENISKLFLYRDREKHVNPILMLESFIQGHQQFQFGGTCFTLNANLLLLLRELGFRCYHVMLSQEHMAIVVVFEDEKKVYVDCGAAAPFFEPIPLDGKAYTVRFGPEEIRLQPLSNTEDVYIYERFYKRKQNGKVWRFDANQKYELSDFVPLIAQSNQPGAPFMSILRCQLWQLDKNRSVSLLNHVLTIRHAHGQEEKLVLHSIEEIEEVLQNDFALGRLPVRESIQVLKELGIDIFRK
ncbi:hypothetical protein GCM10010965_08630 [Caldalkalibacillus thermarum]|uniref:arylamine N-acetyltransferase n=1 Tax=Caldalkalibacillus thermarum TaxID=296745 RepID=UPI001666EC52|nr:arylamine N-acetyltransferase [Caldalkalibacillus thermarum]GGK17904.1 hypothetical protein GCM10010965_08630 [Caldalkalibacillus thermarum]